MNQKDFKTEIEKLWKDLNAHIDFINRAKTNIIDIAEEILMETDATVRNLKKLVSQYTFTDWRDEINFFKNTKPKFVSVYIYYSRILGIESSKPYADPSVLISYYEKERSNLMYFYEENRDFISYYRRNASYLDKKYFVRFKFDFKLKLSAEFYNYDQDFSTSHDHCVSQILANDLLDQYLASKINSDLTIEKKVFQNSPLEWTAPKVALTELLFALYQTKCFNAGQCEISDVFRWAETALDINLGNFHKTLAEIRIRKNYRTRFLDLIQQNMQQYLESSDE
ncbi:hypothetical protein IX39_12155 [Chryseobacterium formosense]|uniref:RteC protein n=1 Tax=Chryseobacterium formosense TaxID=236814 RepID=A0A085ZA65_9FLAO|nr:RteC domain-containing protein [Chryseobacterium formosense]KFF01329.1 hypothetical protein IX39_12155 [Chryseobacterium formosense]SFT45691.1 RteC protein [Chryseobacterium formosense]